MSVGFPHSNDSVADKECDDGERTVAFGAEDRFRVDRRKLERLLQGEGSEDNAEMFFAKVMRETDTVIAWPSKLKIGAKSKKEQAPRLDQQTPIHEFQTSFDLDEGSQMMEEATEKPTTVSNEDSTNTGVNNGTPTMSSDGTPPTSDDDDEMSSDETPPVSPPCASDTPPQPALADPHIKVSGEKLAVSKAKERILNILNTRSSRVTVKIEVSFTEHSHVIGKGGNNIRSVMQDTGCHIHFPDSNRNNQVEKSNQVSIAGSCVGVEEARQKIRALQPLVLMFDLSTIPADPTHTTVIQRIQQMYEVSVTIKPQGRTNSTRKFSPSTVVIRGSVQNTKAIKEATVVLHDHFTGQIGVPFCVTSALDVAPQHHSVILGPSNANIKQIMQRSGATIHFPVGDQQQQLRGTFYITGSPESVCLARHLLLGCIPMTLMFDVEEDVSVSHDQVSQLMEQLGVFISIRPKPKQPSKSVIIKSVERNIINTYEIWRLFSSPDLSGLRGDLSTGFDVSTQPSSAVAPDLFSHTTNVQLVNSGYNTSSPVHHFLQQPTCIPLQTAFPVTPVLIQSTNELLMRPKVPISLAPFVMKSMDNTGAVPSRITSNSKAVHSSNMQRLSDRGPVSDVTCSVPQISYHELSKLNLSSISPESLASQLVSKLQPETVQSLIRSNQSQQSIDLIAQMLNAIGGSSCNSGDAIQSNVEQCHSPTIANAIGSSVFVSCMDGNNVVSDPWQSSSPTESFNSLEESVLCDHNKAPGSNRPKKAINSTFYRETSESADFDYEQMRVKANRAVRSKPVGESRVPNDSWFGCGFSKSMPDADMRMRLSNNVIRGFRQPEMPDTFEDHEDPWKSSSNSYVNYNDTKNSMINHNVSMSSHSVMEFGGNSLSNDVDLSCLPRDDHPYNADMTISLGADSSLWPSSSEKTVSPVLATGKEALIGAKELWDDEEDLAELFGRLGLGKYTDLFQHQEIDMSTFLTLNDNDLKELGITTFGARRRMLNAIANLNKRQSLQLSVRVGPSSVFTSANQNSSQRHDNVASQSGRW